MELLQAEGKSVPLMLVRHRKARRYILRLLRDGTARVTMPWRGTLEQARAMAVQHANWLAAQIKKLSQTQAEPDWSEGTVVLLRGEALPLRVTKRAEGELEVGLGPELVKLTEGGDFSIKGIVQQRLWAVAKRELPPRVQQLADLNGLKVNRVTVRNQKSRWGSCSRRGTISLNWRLVQTPDFVRDYIIIHELAHLRHMNHSAQFWSEVSRICPDYLAAERWLKTHRSLLK